MARVSTFIFLMYIMQVLSCVPNTLCSPSGTEPCTEHRAGVSRFLSLCLSSKAAHRTQGARRLSPRTQSGRGKRAEGERREPVAGTQEALQRATNAQET